MMPWRQDNSKRQASCSTIFRNIYLVNQTKERMALICMIDSPDIASEGIHIFWMKGQVFLDERSGNFAT